MTRASAAYTDRYLETDWATRQLFYCGSNLVRPVIRKDVLGRFIRGILLEPQVQNLCLQSQTLNTTWTKVALTSITNDSGAGPDGTNTLDGLIATAVDTQHGVTQAVTLTAASYIFSKFFAPGNKTWIKLFNSTIANGACYFQASGDGVIGASPGAGLTRYEIKRWGSSLYRAQITFTGTAAAHTLGWNIADDDNDDSVLGDASTINIHSGCAQVSAGVFASSYIPTTTAAVTRQADSGPKWVNPWPNAKEGSLAVVILLPSHAPAADLPFLRLDDGSANNRLELASVATTGLPRLTSVVGAAAKGSASGGSTVASDRIHTIHAGWRPGMLAVGVDGQWVGCDDTDVDVASGLTAIECQPFGGVLGDLYVAPSFSLTPWTHRACHYYGMGG